MKINKIQREQRQFLKEMKRKFSIEETKHFNSTPIRIDPHHPTLIAAAGRCPICDDIILGSDMDLQVHIENCSEEYGRTDYEIGMG